MIAASIYNIFMLVSCRHLDLTYRCVLLSANQRQIPACTALLYQSSAAESDWFQKWCIFSAWVIRL